MVLWLYFCGHRASGKSFLWSPEVLKKSSFEKLSLKSLGTMQEALPTEALGCMHKRKKVESRDIVRQYFD